jgi:hypothetical protein
MAFAGFVEGIAYLPAKRAYSPQGLIEAAPSGVPS